MFSVLFEVRPGSDERNAYLDYATMLRPELEQIDGFVDNIRYRSLTREGWILSLSGWDTEKALVRWRTRARHHQVQEQGRSRILTDYHLRVGELTHDSDLPPAHALVEQRLDETEVGDGTTVTLLDGYRPAERVNETSPADIAAWFGMDGAARPVSWDVFDAVLSPGSLILLATWRDREAADAFTAGVSLHDGIRLRQVRVVRDYGMYDRREAPQYYPAIGRP
jgi:heme-degrading monooxygenase HmoA